MSRVRTSLWFVARGVWFGGLAWGLCALLGRSQVDRVEIAALVVVFTTLFPVMLIVCLHAGSRLRARLRHRR